CRRREPSTWVTGWAGVSLHGSGICIIKVQRRLLKPLRHALPRTEGAKGRNDSRRLSLALRSAFMSARRGWHTIKRRWQRNGDILACTVSNDATGQRLAREKLGSCLFFAAAENATQ